MKWWKVFQDKEEKVESKEPCDENKENDVTLSEDEMELDEVDKEIKKLQVTNTIDYMSILILILRSKVYKFHSNIYNFSKIYNF